MPSDRSRLVSRRVIIRDDQLRERLAVDVVRHHCGRHHPDDAIPISRRVGTIRYCWGVVLKKTGAWFPVTRRDVARARLRAFGAGVTFSTYADFHLLRRNYEADPTPFWSGMWIKRLRDPPPRIPRALSLTWTHSGISLIEFVDELGRMDAEFVDAATEMQQEIRTIIADMCRPLEPRRRRRRQASSID